MLVKLFLGGVDVSEKIKGMNFLCLEHGLIFGLLYFNYLINLF